KTRLQQKMECASRTDYTSRRAWRNQKRTIVGLPREVLVMIERHLPLLWYTKRFCCCTHYLVIVSANEGLCDNHRKTGQKVYLKILKHLPSSLDMSLKFWPLSLVALVKHARAWCK